MINSTSTINIDGVALEGDELNKVFSINQDDKFSRWVVRPLALLTVVGIGAAMLFASAFLILISLAMVPFLLLFFWALKTKLARDLANADAVVDTQSHNDAEQAGAAQVADVQTAS